MRRPGRCFRAGAGGESYRSGWDPAARPVVPREPKGLRGPTATRAAHREGGEGPQGSGATPATLCAANRICREEESQLGLWGVRGISPGHKGGWARTVATGPVAGCGGATCRRCPPLRRSGSAPVAGNAEGLAPETRRTAAGRAAHFWGRIDYYRGEVTWPKALPCFGFRY